MGRIMKGGAVALDGRIEPGDMILQVPHSLILTTYIGSIFNESGSGQKSESGSQLFLNINTAWS